MTIKAIETEYNGYKFRSRLEARWAVFFDVLGLKYQYEPDGFEGIYGAKYLPDFYLPKEDLYIEVKGSDEQLEKDWNKIAQAIDFNFTPCSNGLVILGQIPNPNSVKWGSIPVFNYFYCEKGIVCDWLAFTGIRISTGKIIGRVLKGIDLISKAMIGNPSFFDIEYTTVDGGFPECHLTTDTRLFSLDHLRSASNDGLKDAYKIARQARFEHGETPVIAHD